MADPATTYAVDNTAVVQVKANTPCKRIVVQENYDSANPPTADLLMYKPATSTTPVRVAKGTPMIFSDVWGYEVGQVVGGIKTSSGSITVQQIESAEV